MTEGVEDQEVTFLYKVFFLRLDPISWSLWKGKRISRSPFREGRIREILLIAVFSRSLGKLSKKRLEWYDPSVTPE